MVLKKWNSDTTLKFILLYKQQECLWKIDSISYRNRNTRNAALKKILEGMKIPGLTLDDVKKKIKYLRSTFMVEVNKIEQSMLSDDGTGNVYKPCLSWFDVMNSFIKSVKSVKVYNDTQDLSITADDNSDSYDIHESIKPPTPESQHSKDNSVTSYLNLETLNRKRGRTHADNDKRTSSPKSYLNTSKPPYDKKESTNEFEIFGKYVGIQLKSLNEEDAIMAQQEIQSILTRYKLKNLRRRTETCYIVHSPYQSVVNETEYQSPDTNEDAVSKASQYVDKSQYEEDYEVRQ